MAIEKTDPHTLLNPTLDPTITIIKIPDGSMRSANTSVTDLNVAQYPYLNINNPQVLAGLFGPQGMPGPKGPKGDKGDKGDQGIPGLQGRSIEIKGSVETYQQLPESGLSAGDGYIAADTGHLWVYMGNTEEQLTARGSSEIAQDLWVNSQPLLGSIFYIDLSGLRTLTINIPTPALGAPQGTTLNDIKSVIDAFNIEYLRVEVEQITLDAGTSDERDINVLAFYLNLPDAGSYIQFSENIGNYVLQSLGLTTSRYFQPDSGYRGFVDSGPIRGPQGEAGPKGEKGDKGDPGTSVKIVGTVATPEELPIPYEGAAGDGILDDDGFLWIYDGEQFTNVGKIKGPKGDIGISPTIEIGNVVALPSGSTPLITNTGTSTNLVLNFSIPRGLSGLPGAKGDKGDTGDAGDTGATGPQGLTGPAGTITVGTVTSGSPLSVVNVGTSSNAVLNFVLPKGDKGDAATIEVGTVSTGDPGTDVEITNSGTTGAAVFDFTIPRGDVGEPGPNGADGLSVYDLAVANGFVGSEQDFLDSLKGDTGDTGAEGQQGASAYQIAVAAGFEGDETAWLASLVGPQGEPGINGASYNLSADATTGGAYISLNGSDESWDTVKLAEGTNVTIAQTDNSTITISASSSGIPGWTSAGTIESVGWTATTTSPTLGVTTRNNISYRQIGDKEWEVVMVFDTTGVTASAGSGDYLFTLPNGLSFDTTLPWQTIFQGDENSSTYEFNRFALPSSLGQIANTSTGSSSCHVLVWDSTKFRIAAHLAGTGIRCFGSGWFQITFNEGLQLRFTFTST